MAPTIKPIPQFPMYSVSSTGEVFGQRGQLLKPDRLKGGYLRFRPCVGKKMKMMMVHRAVVLAFIGDPPDGERRFVGHRNGIPDDNRLENLRWVSYEENWDDRKAHGNGGFGTQNGRAKFTQDKADALRAMYGTGEYTYQQVADHFGISQAQANKIGRGLYWPALYGSEA